MSNTNGRPSIPLPSPIRRSSFANLARFFRLGSVLTDIEVEKHDDSAEEDDGDVQDDAQDVDEESLMWDAQAALIAHQPALAIQRYTTAALPPYRSAPACLALGNLLTRGTGFQTSPSTSLEQPTHPKPTSRKGKEKAAETPTSPSMSSSSLTSPSSPPAFSQFFRTFFGATPQSPSETIPPSMTTSPNAERKYDLVGNGWAMRKEGKRAVRDVEGMGVAGGWLVLGLGWIVDGQLSKITQEASFRAAVQIPNISREVGTVSQAPSYEDAIVMSLSRSNVKGAPLRLHINPKSSEPRESPLTSTTASRHPSTTDLSTVTESSATASSAAQTGETVDSIILETPDSEVSDRNRDWAAETKLLRLIYDLLQPLLRLYRHGHIQASDPVFLPPITSSQLPTVLRPVGDLQKRRNAWALGAVVAGRLLQIDALQSSVGLEHAQSKERIVRDWRQLACGVRNVANYILGMTSDKHLREGYFRSIVDVGPCGLTLADDVVRQAAKRLDLICGTTSEPPTPQLSHEGYPFPQMSTLSPPSRKSSTSRRSKVGNAGHKSQTSLSTASAPRRNVSGRSLRPSEADSGIKVSSASPQTTSSPGHVHSSSRMFSGNRISAANTLRQAASSSTLTRHQRESSSASILSLLSPSPERALKCLPTEASTAQCDTQVKLEQAIVARRGSATETLKRVRESSLELTQTAGPVYPSLHGWKMAVSPPTSNASTPSSPPTAAPKTNVQPMVARKQETLRNMTSSPNLPTMRDALSPPTKQHRSVSSFAPPRSQASSASLLGGDVEIAQIDPTLAAAELASALTKHVCCSVCATKGVNFPECRKCGMRFCSRDCRVGEQGAGDGKRHLCGIWKTRLARAKEAGLRSDGSGLPSMSVSFAESLGKTPTAVPGVRAF